MDSAEGMLPVIFSCTHFLADFMHTHTPTRKSPLGTSEKAASERRRVLLSRQERRFLLKYLQLISLFCITSDMWQKKMKKMFAFICFSQQLRELQKEHNTFARMTSNQRTNIHWKFEEDKSYFKKIGDESVFLEMFPVVWAAGTEAEWL